MVGTYTPKNILVTGGAGFIGSNFVVQMSQKYPQYKFVIFDKLDFNSNINNLNEVQYNENFKFIRGNIAESDFVTHVLKVEDIDTIVHFAAQTHVDNTFGNSFSFTTNNVVGTHKMLEAAKGHGKIQRFIYVSSDEVYGGSKDDNISGFNDQSILQPRNPYAATKGAAEFLVHAYNRSFKLPTIVTRITNVYGPKQYPEKLIPKFILLLLQNKLCPIYGKGLDKRNYLYVDDVISAFDILVHLGAPGDTYNIGTDFAVSTKDATESLLHALGRDPADFDQYVTNVEERPFADYRYPIISDKLIALGWKPQTSWEEGIKKTVEWYLKHKHYWFAVENVLTPHPSANLRDSAYIPPVELTPNMLKRRFSSSSNPTIRTSKE